MNNNCIHIVIVVKLQKLPHQPEIITITHITNLSYLFCLHPSLIHHLSFNDYEKSVDFTEVLRIEPRGSCQSGYKLHRFN